MPKFKLTASTGRSDDEEFLRRVTLDLTGIIPTAEDVRAFTGDRSSNKRAALIDRLLSSDEYARHMAVTFDIMLMERRADGHVSNDEWRGYLAESFRNNKPLDVLVRELLASDGSDPAMRSAAKFFLDREAAHDTLVRDIGRLFLGVDLQCAQCHDHPTVADYRHLHYYGLHVFVAGTKLYRPTSGGKLMSLQEEVVREATFASVFEPEVQNKTGPRLLSGPAMEVPTFKAGDEYVEKPSAKTRAVPKFSLRKALSETLPRAETREFSRNMANRLWAHLMGRGLVQPLDMHHSANPPSHPELLALLSDELTAMKFDVRRFLREVALSKAYQRSSLAPAGLSPDDVPEESFAMANLKGLGPEPLFASLVRATGNGVTLERQIEEAAKKEPVNKEADDALRVKARAVERAKRIKEFTELFGSPAGSPEGEFQASLPQALFLANAESIAAWLQPQNDNLTARLAKLSQPESFAEELYLSILSRHPTTAETAAAQKHLSEVQDRVSAIEQLVWSLVASAEFRLNH
ncbi:MAG: DUF1549 and DUF1553 domain-containing protein [Planctomycetia bacterium]|nr:DUF1549 and DUF1553 domain-containing protein [Planctomycetia bacterium]